MWLRYGHWVATVDEKASEEGIWAYIQRACEEVEKTWSAEKRASADAAVERRVRRDLERHPCPIGIKARLGAESA